METLKKADEALKKARERVLAAYLKLNTINYFIPKDVYHFETK